jgi:prepilin-type processing-associated H-X9-DG protein
MFARRRAGVTVFEAVVGLVVMLVVAGVAIPLIYRGTQSLRKSGCSYNLHNLGQAIDAYQTAHAGTLPCGSRYHASPNSPWGTSWWVDLLPYTGTVEKGFSWDIHVASPGDFAGPTVNPNLKHVNGLSPTLMQCPASPLPASAGGLETISKANSTALGGTAHSIAVPSYVAIAGSAPDMLGVSATQPVSAPHGRNTQDGPLGILSSSGAFPQNQALKISGLRDGMGHVIIVGEQSSWGIDAKFEKPVRFDLRSSYPGGAYKGAGGEYHQLGTHADGIDGTGAERCFNITTVRYAINTVDIDVEHWRKGIIAKNADPYPPPAKDKPERKPAKLPAGPGHNHGLFSAHARGAHVLYADAHVDFRSDDMSLPVLQQLITRDDGAVAE